MAQTPLVCEWVECGEPLPAYSGRGRPAKYHPACKKRKDEKEYRARKRAKPGKTVAEAVRAINRPVKGAGEALDGRGSMRRGDDYYRWVDDGGPQEVERGATHEQIAAKYGVSRVTVTHWMAAYREDLLTERKRAGWRRSDHAEQCLDDFVMFRDTYFTDRKGQPYRTEWFHQEWIDAIYEAYRTGSKVAILAPPRHGKTELLIAFMCWLIIKHPNISIIWIGKSEDLAEKSVGAVLNQLEHNDNLIADFCGPGGSFKPPGRSGVRWTRSEFTVATRDIYHKSPTMVAVGAGGTLLSRDADFMVGDDIEDDKSTRQPAQREGTKEWMSKDVESRVEDGTGQAYIGSRQHPEDLAGFLESNPEWRTLIYSAHNPDCALPWVEEHIDDHVDCMLFPAVRSARWLFKKRRAIANDAIYEMQYLNKPRTDGLTIFEREMVEQCRDYSRSLGDVPPNTRLIAGLDPASSGYQAAVLWAVHVESNTMFLIDIENVQGGGVVHMRSIIERWSGRYPGLVEWVVEENIVEDTLKNDVPLQELKKQLRFQFIRHKTGRNKWDLRMGVKGLKPMFVDKQIVLPYGDSATRERVEPLINQFVNFTDQVSSHQTSYKTDLVMAAWFPFPTIQGWQREFFMGMQVQYQTSAVGRDLGGVFGTEYQ